MKNAQIKEHLDTIEQALVDERCMLKAYKEYAGLPPHWHEEIDTDRAALKQAWQSLMELRKHLGFPTSVLGKDQREA